MRPTRVHIIPGDWSHLEVELNHLTKWIASQGVSAISSPTFAGLTLNGNLSMEGHNITNVGAIVTTGLTLTGMTGILRANAGIVSADAVVYDSGLKLLLAEV